MNTAIHLEPRPLIRIAYAAVVLLCAAGCGSQELKAYQVTGKVVYRGTSEAVARLSRGYVCLVSVSDPNNKPVGQIEEEGTFFLGTTIDGKNLGGVLPGEYRVRVVPPRDAESGRTPRGLIDPRYSSFEKSEIRLTIAAGKNDITIEVDRPRR